MGKIIKKIILSLTSRSRADSAAHHQTTATATAADTDTVVSVLPIWPGADFDAKYTSKKVHNHIITSDKI